MAREGGNAEMVMDSTALAMQPHAITKQRSRAIRRRTRRA
ncbi:hypothetical protein FHS99_003300 [Sphingomonas prati]|uniref:Uncharacterized protein n=1 Tax=Sphingomonas prati TaxID=1843237 RepID=A0A7W9BW81_9SPHN|nr:hypothetical protein [Sphingomonas prati]